MCRNEKMKFIRLIEGSELCISDALAKYDVPRSTYYRWKQKLRNQGIKGLADNKPYRARTWNQLLPWQIDQIRIAVGTPLTPNFSAAGLLKPMRATIADPKVAHMRPAPPLDVRIHNVHRVEALAVSAPAPQPRLR